MKFISGFIVLFLIGPELEAAASPKRCESGTWVKASEGQSLIGRLRIGVRNGKLRYLIRGFYAGGVLSGELYDRIAHFQSHGSNIELSDYEVFCGDPISNWAPTTKGNIPRNAILVGENSYSEPLYVCRKILDDWNIFTGTVQNGACKIPFVDHETEFEKFDILVEENIIQQ